MILSLYSPRDVLVLRLTNYELNECFEPHLPLLIEMETRISKCASMSPLDWPFIFPGGRMFPDTFSFLGNYSVMMPDASTHSLCQVSIVSLGTTRKVLFQHRRIRKNQAPFKLTALYPVRGEHSIIGIESSELVMDNAVPQPLGCAKPETSL
jgi:hypothetical protein